MIRGATMTGKTTERPGPGALVMIVGPSGAGKDTLLRLVRGMLGADGKVVFPRRSVTRESSSFEDNEVVSGPDFERNASSGNYALWWRAHGHGYGISRSIDGDLAAGRMVVVNVSRAIIGDARRRYERAFVVLITAPAEVLAARLATRNRDSDGDLQARLERVPPGPSFIADATICNIDSAEDRARELVRFLSSVG